MGTPLGLSGGGAPRKTRWNCSLAGPSYRQAVLGNERWARGPGAWKGACMRGAMCLENEHEGSHGGEDVQTESCMGENALAARGMGENGSPGHGLRRPTDTKPCIGCTRILALHQ